MRRHRGADTTISAADVPPYAPPTARPDVSSVFHPEPGGGADPGFHLTIGLIAGTGIGAASGIVLTYLLLR